MLLQCSKSVTHRKKNISIHRHERHFCCMKDGTNKKSEVPLPGSAYHPQSQYFQLYEGREQALKEKDG
jgi:uncharacterized beta-barrel protein YwiB (DUF1934 family)